MTPPNHIQAPSADPDLLAQRLLRDRGAELLTELGAKVALAELEVPLIEREQAVDQLIEFCTRRVARHLLAADQALYAPAAGAAETRLLVRALRVQHDLVAARIAAVQQADSSAEVTAAAHALVGALQICLHVEHEVLVPALAALPGVDLSALIDEAGALLAGDASGRPSTGAIRGLPLGA